ncbi:MAG: hypothetical protein ACE5I1_31080, partial [bacterium]
MNRIIILDDVLESQMRMYLALCNKYRVEIAEDEAMLMRMIRRKNPKLILLDANYSGFNNNGKSVYKTIEKIKKKYNDLKVVTILDRHDMDLHRSATQKASDAVLLRPVDELNVIKSVNEQL